MILAFNHRILSHWTLIHDGLCNVDGTIFWAIGMYSSVYLLLHVFCQYPCVFKISSKLGAVQIAFPSSSLKNTSAEKQRWENLLKMSDFNLKRTVHQLGIRRLCFHIEVRKHKKSVFPLLPTIAPPPSQPTKSQHFYCFSLFTWIVSRCRQYCA